MGRVLTGRWTADVQGDFVVVIIGAKLRNPFRAAKALPMLAQMPRMLEDLQKDPSKGLLGYQAHGFGPFGCIVQYWRSFEDLERFARNPDDRHAKVWRDWYRLGQQKNSAVGIWHETYKVRAGVYEAVYQGMGDFGLMKAGHATPVGSRSESAAIRIGATESPTPRPVDDEALA
jgi:hypothetical protein